MATYTPKTPEELARQAGLAGYSPLPTDIGTTTEASIGNQLMAQKNNITPTVPSTNLTSPPPGRTPSGQLLDPYTNEPIDSALGSIYNQQNQLPTSQSIMDMFKTAGIASTQLEDEAQLRATEAANLAEKKSAIEKQAQVRQQEIEEAGKFTEGGVSARGHIFGGSGQTGLGMDSAITANIAMVRKETQKAISDLDARKQEALANADMDSFSRINTLIGQYRDRMDKLTQQEIDNKMKTLDYLLNLSNSKKTDYKTLSEGQTLIDPTTGKVIYRAPSSITADIKLVGNTLLEKNAQTGNWETVYTAPTDKKIFGSAESGYFEYDENTGTAKPLVAGAATSNKTTTLYRNDPTTGRLLRITKDAQGNEINIEVVKSPVEAVKGQIVYTQDESPVKLTDTQATFLSQGLTLNGLADDVKQTLNNVDTSAIKGWYTEKGYLVPIVQDSADPQMIDLMQKMYAMNNLFVYFSTGKQINETEFERLSKQNPNLRANSEYNRMAIDNFSNMINDRMNNYLQVNGWKVSGGSEANADTFVSRIEETLGMSLGEQERTKYTEGYTSLKQKYPEASDEQIYEIINSGGFNNVGGDTDKATKALSVASGTKVGQCGRFVNKYTGLGLGDSYQSKISKMDKSIKTPEPGMVFVMPYKDTGHTGFIVAVNDDNTVTVKDSNWSLDEKVKTHKIPISKITGLRRV